MFQDAVFKKIKQKPFLASIAAALVTQMNV